MTTQTKTRVLETLKVAQANVMMLYLNAKHHHWYLYGPLFRDLHLLMDEIAVGAREQIDPFGERIRILGGDPLWTPDDIKNQATIQPTSKTTPGDMLREILDQERQIIRQMREGAHLAEEEGDPGTNDLYSSSVQHHEKYAWFLEETLRQQDGIVT